MQSKPQNSTGDSMPDVAQPGVALVPVGASVGQRLASQTESTTAQTMVESATSNSVSSAAQLGP